MYRSYIVRATMMCSASLLILGCAPPDGDELGAQAPDAEAPAIEGVTLIGNPNPTVPLAAILSVATDVPTRLTLNVDDGERSWSVTPEEAMTTEHELPVLGLRAGRTHTITATVEDGTGLSSETDAQTFVTPPLPEAFPTPAVTVRDPSRMEPGVTIFNVNGRWDTEGNSTPANFSPAVVVGR